MQATKAVAFVLKVIFLAIFPRLPLCEIEPPELDRALTARFAPEASAQLQKARK